MCVSSQDSIRNPYEILKKWFCEGKLIGKGCWSLES